MVVASRREGPGLSRHKGGCGRKDPELKASLSYRGKHSFEKQHKSQVQLKPVMPALEKRITVSLRTAWLAEEGEGKKKREREVGSGEMV